MDLVLKQLIDDGAIVPMSLESPFSGITTTVLGNYAIAAENHEKKDLALAGSLGNKYFFKIHAQHKDTIIRINADTDKNTYIPCDALIIEKKIHPYAILLANTADCPVLVVTDEANSVIGIAHCGWSGTELQLPIKLINTMVKVYGISPEKFSVHIWPGICKDCFEVEKNKFEAKPILGKYIWNKGNSEKGNIDLAVAIEDQLKEAGVRANSIHKVANACSSHSTLDAEHEYAYPFHSNRRGGKFDKENQIEDPLKMQAKMRNTVFAYFYSLPF